MSTSGARGAQLVKCLTLDLSWGVDLRVVSSAPCGAIKKKKMPDAKSYGDSGQTNRGKEVVKRK